MLQVRQRMFSSFWEVYNDTKGEPVPDMCKGTFTSERIAKRAILLSADYVKEKPKKILSDHALLSKAKATPGVSTQEALKNLKAERAQIILSGNFRE